MAKDKKVEFNFESALAELNQLVEKMEAGGGSLEESLKNFERGVHLTRQCQEALKAAEQKVEILLQKQDGLSLEPYQSDNKES